MADWKRNDRDGSWTSVDTDGETYIVKPVFTPHPHCEQFWATCWTGAALTPGFHVGVNLHKDIRRAMAMMESIMVDGDAADPRRSHAQ